MAKYVGFKIGKVHESQVISEYYCGGCGYPVTDHDSFCPECGGAFRECDASNLEEENAKLRELVRDMWNGMCGYAHECRSCEHYELYEGQRFVGECEYHRRIRELGIEVGL